MEPQLFRDNDKKRAANVFWLRKRSQRLVEISMNMAELCVNPDNIEAASVLFLNIHSWDPDFKKSSSHASNYFTSLIFVSILSCPNTCNENSQKHAHKHTQRKTRHDCETFLWTSDREREMKQTGRLTQLKGIRSATIDIHNRVQKEFEKIIFLSLKTILLSFFFSNLSKHLYQRLDSGRANPSNPPYSLYTCTTHTIASLTSNYIGQETAGLKQTAFLY